VQLVCHRLYLPNNIFLLYQAPPRVIVAKKYTDLGSTFNSDETICIELENIINVIVILL